MLVNFVRDVVTRKVVGIIIIICPSAAPEPMKTTSSFSTDARGALGF
jgi:hypothetical protein